MSLSIGIVGLPNVGKSTLFNAITKAGAESANYPFCTIEPNVGIVDVPDQRLIEIAKLVNPKRILPAQCKFVDIAGLVEGASKGEGLGNKFLSHIREVSSIVHVVRCFDDDNIIHVAGRVGPAEDIETINLELILADLESVEKRLEKLQRQKKSGDKLAAQEQEVLLKIKEYLDLGKKANNANLTEEEEELIKSLSLLTLKNVLYLANVGEDESDALNNKYVKQVQEIANSEGSTVMPLCVALESELADLDETERSLFMQELGLKESGLDSMINQSYALLDLITYFTAGEQEARAWTISRGTKAPRAASEIHSDIERGFIRAEVISYDDFMSNGSIAAGKEKGLLRLEGKEYIVQDGDIIHFRFAV